jgi:AcrR family transcriptional regulator
MADPVKRRAYTSSVRKEQAAATRTRILEAAAVLFERDGYVRTTVKQIADEAGVAADTVYAVFGSKGRVLTALIDHVLTGGAPGMTNVLERPEFAAIRDESDQRKQIAMYARASRDTLARVRPIFNLMRTAADVDEEMAGIYREMQGYRLRNTTTVVEWIAANGKLRVPIKRAGEIVWGIASPELSGMMIERIGWTEDECFAYFEDVIARALLRDDPPAKRSRGRPN